MIRIFFLSVLSLLMIGCGKKKGFKMISGSQAALSSISYPDYLAKMSKSGNSGLPVIAPDCFENSEYDTCIMRNGLVYQIGKPPVKPYWGEDLSVYQSLGAKLIDLDGSGFLKNQYINVTLDGGAERVTKNAQNNFKFPISKTDPNPNNGVLNLQVTTYVYMTGLRKLFEEKAGTFPVFLYPIYVESLADYSLDFLDGAFYDPGSSSIFLGYSFDGKYGMGMDSDVALHEYGHGILHVAAGGRLMGVDPNASRISLNTVCNTLDGCLSAIHEGQADFHVAIISPNDPRLGSTYWWLNKGLLTGLRNPLLDIKLKRGSVDPEIHELGRVYSSIWYHIYLWSGFDDELIKLFHLHQQDLTLDDTFLTARDKIIYIDQQVLNGKFAEVFRAEFARRGYK